MVNSIYNAVNAFLIIWRSLPDPILYLSSAVIVLFLFRVVFEVVTGH